MQICFIYVNRSGNLTLAKFSSLCAAEVISKTSCLTSDDHLITWRHFHFRVHCHRCYQWWYVFENACISLTHCSLVTPYGLVNIGPGNGLLPDVTKPLPKPMLTWSMSDNGIHMRTISQRVPTFQNLMFLELLSHPPMNQLTHWCWICCVDF